MAALWQVARGALALWARRVSGPQLCLPGEWLRREAREGARYEEKGGGRGLRGGRGREGAALPPSSQSRPPQHGGLARPPLPTWRRDGARASGETFQTWQPPPARKRPLCYGSGGVGGELTFPSWCALPRDSRLSAPSSVM